MFVATPDQALRVLIVEDREAVQSLLSKFFDQIRELFPRMTIQTVTRLDDALRIIRGDCRPDIVTLDLALEDSGTENTLSFVEEIENLCPVLIVTGNKVEGFSQILDRLNVEVIKKGGQWLEDNRFIRAVARTVTRGTERETDRMQKRIEKMRALLGLMSSHHHPESHTPNAPPTT